MRLKILLFLSPIILLSEIYCFSWITELLRQQSDISVLVGIALTCGFIIGNFYLIKLITKKIKKNEKNNDYCRIGINGICKLYKN